MRHVVFKTGKNEQEYARWHVRELFEGKGWGKIEALCLRPEDWSYLYTSQDKHFTDGDDLIREDSYVGDWNHWWRESTGYLGEYVFLCPVCAIEIGVAVIEEVPDVKK